MVLAKNTLREIAERLPDEATYLDVMYELYVRMKIAKGKEAARQGRLVSQAEVRQRLTTS
jgi:hypothetical protein